MPGSLFAATARHGGLPHRQGARHSAGVRDTIPPVAADRGLTIDVTNPLYYVSRTSLRRTAAPGMRQWRKRLFVLAARNASDPVEYFALPDERVVILGARVNV